MINTTRLRCMIGWLGIALPWIIVLLYGGFPTSISTTYYNSTTIVPFVVVLGSAGFLLMSYKGYDLEDDIVNTLAGITGICVTLFPCYNGNYTNVGTFNLPVATSSNLHIISALSFFALLSWNSIFLFTKTATPRHWEKGNNMFGTMWNFLVAQFTTPNDATENKRKRNIIYRVCGFGMLASFLIMLIPYNVLNIRTWLCETIALLFFGISYLTKADCYSWLFTD